jgi:hypothetical protein
MCRELMPEAVYGEITAANRGALDEHLAGCRACSDELAGLEYAVAVMKERRPPQVPLGFWEQTWSTFVKRLEQAGGDGKLRSWHLGPWMLNLAAAAALVVVGVFIGRFVWFTPPVEQVPQLAQPAPPDGSAALDDRIDRYLERTKLLLMSVDNLAVEAHAPDRAYLSEERKLSKTLLRETRSLKNDLETSREELLLELVSHVEIILLQISNLRDAQAALGIELARTGIQDGALLFRINLEEMRRASERISRAKKVRETPARRVG